MTSKDIERRVQSRAADRCEYCQMHPSLQGATFHVEHVVPRSKGGATTLDNLAWACLSCNLRKSNRTEIEDPQTNETVTFFNPRENQWADHFR